MEKQYVATREQILYIALNYADKGPTLLSKEMGLPRTKIANIASKLRKHGVNIPKKNPGKGESPLHQVVEELKQKGY